MFIGFLRMMIELRRKDIDSKQSMTMERVSPSRSSVLLLRSKIPSVRVERRERRHERIEQGVSLNIVCEEVGEGLSEIREDKIASTIRECQREEVEKRELLRVIGMSFKNECSMFIGSDFWLTGVFIESKSDGVFLHDVGSEVISVRLNSDALFYVQSSECRHDSHRHGL